MKYLLVKKLLISVLYITLYGCEFLANVDLIEHSGDSPSVPSLLAIKFFKHLVEGLLSKLVKHINFLSLEIQDLPEVSLDESCHFEGPHSCKKDSFFYAY